MESLRIVQDKMHDMIEMKGSRLDFRTACSLQRAAAYVKMEIPVLV